VEESIVSTASAGISVTPSESLSTTGESGSSTATSVPVADTVCATDLWTIAQSLWYCGNNLTKPGRGNTSLCEDDAYFVDFLDKLPFLRLLFLFIEKAVPGMRQILLVEHGSTGVMFT
jgi:hypothetical protein